MTLHTLLSNCWSRLRGSPPRRDWWQDGPDGPCTDGRPGDVALIVVHTAEVPCRSGMAEIVARGFTRPRPDGSRASAHWVVDPGAALHCVSEYDQSWHAASSLANAVSVGIEHCGYCVSYPLHGVAATDWTRGEGAAVVALGGRVAGLVARMCGIPLVRLGDEQLRALRAHLLVHGTGVAVPDDLRGVCGHGDLTRCGWGGTHGDPWTRWPWDAWLAAAKEERDAG